MNKYKTKKGIVYKNQFHVIWTVKYRKELLTGKIEERLKEIIYEVCQEKEAELKAIEVMPDHVHVFIDVDPRQPLHKKCSLEVRFKELIQGIVVQRDLYSAFLIKNVENLSEYNMKKINRQFEKFYEKQLKEIERIKNEGGLKFYVSGKTV